MVSNGGVNPGIIAEPFLNGFGAGVGLIIVAVLYNQTELMEWRETARRVEDGKTAVSARGVGVVFKVHPSLWQGGFLDKAKGHRSMGT